MGPNQIKSLLMGTQSRTTRIKNVAPDGAACALLTTSEKLEIAKAIIGHSGREKQEIVVMLSFSKTPLSKCFSSTAKTQSRHFRIPPIWRAFLRDRLVWTADLTVKITELRFHISPAECGHGLILKKKNISYVHDSVRPPAWYADIGEVVFKRLWRVPLLNKRFCCHVGVKQILARRT